MDHTDASATASAAARICAVAADTRCRGVAIAVMTPTQAPATDSGPSRIPLFHRGSGHDVVTIEAVFPQVVSRLVADAPPASTTVDGREPGAGRHHPPTVPVAAFRSQPRT